MTTYYQGYPFHVHEDPLLERRSRGRKSRDHRLLDRFRVSGARAPACDERHHHLRHTRCEDRKERQQWHPIPSKRKERREESDEVRRNHNEEPYRRPPAPEEKNENAGYEDERIEEAFVETRRPPPVKGVPIADVRV